MSERSVVLRYGDRVLLAVGAILVVASVILPWWGLHSSVVNGSQTLFDFTIGPLGVGVQVVGFDPSNLLSELKVVYLAITIAMLPISISLGLAAFNGFYCAARRRRGSRVFVAPLWAVIALFWWFFYFLLLYSLFSTMGLDIPISGSRDVTWQSFQLLGASWGWELGLWMAIAGVVVMFIGGALSIKSAKLEPVPSEVRLTFGLHSVGLLVIGVFNIIAMLFLFLVTQMALLIVVPVILLFVMSVLARSPKTVRSIVPTQPPPPLFPQPFEAMVPPPPLQWPQSGIQFPSAPPQGEPPYPAPPTSTPTPQLFCHQCGTLLVLGAPFCPKCGARTG